MMKLFYVSIALALFGYQASSQNIVTVRGTVKGDTKGYNHVYVYGLGITSDTAKIVDGQFEFKIPFTQPMAPLFYTEYDVKVKKGVSPYPILLEQAGQVDLKDVDIEKGLHSGTLSGMKSVEEFQAFNRVNGGVAELKDFVQQHPKSYSSIYLLNRMRGSVKVADLESIYQQLDKKIKQIKEGKAVSEYIAGVKSSAIGKTVQNFTLNDPQDKPFSFNTLRGKYVIIDFWASWCGPCKASFPHMKVIYDKYKGDKFEIYSISTDHSKSAWLNDLAKLNLPWLQVLDTKNVSGGQFGVTAIPATYLIDPQGKILLKELGFQPDGTSKVEKMLTELLSESKTR